MGEEAENFEYMLFLTPNGCPNSRNVIRGVDREKEWRLFVTMLANRFLSKTPKCPCKLHTTEIKVINGRTVPFE